MKSFRIWQAARLIFLYPENWVEPELRDDKTPFFAALESALLQDDINAETAEEAFVAYLEKLDGVARLEIGGVYHQEAADGQPDILHVFGRSHGTPPNWYYRQWIGRSRWTAWEPVDLDINVPQIIPLIWNRRLMLFWPVFTEVAVEASPPPDKPTPPSRHFEIQLAWSERKRGRWMGKKTTPETMKIVSLVPYDTNKPDHGVSLHAFRAAFDGPGLKIWYEFDDPQSFFTLPYGGSQPIGAATVSGFFFRTMNGPIETFNLTITGIYQPTGTQVAGMLFSGPSGQALNLPTTVGSAAEAAALASTPTNYSVAYAYQDGQVTGSRPIFFQDALKAFSVEPFVENIWTWLWTRPDWIDPGIISLITSKYYETKPYLDPLAPIESVYDPSPIELAAVQRIAAALPSPGTEGIRLRGTVAAVAAAPAASTSITDPRVIAERRQSLTGASLTWRGDAARSALAEGRDVNWIVSKGDKSSIDLADYVADNRLIGDRVAVSKQVRRYRFRTFYHPYVTQFFSLLGVGGLDALLRRDTQLVEAKPFEPVYKPTALVAKGDPAKLDQYPVEDVDFSFGGAYAQYNWELFFHAPLLIAYRLSQNQRFEEAQRWFHTIFDPTDTSAYPIPDRYWRTQPFFRQRDLLKDRISEIVAALAAGEAAPDIEAEVAAWRADPANPFAVARLRTTAFQKRTVMLYLDNLIAWGDQLFRRDTIESINEATQLYVLAAEILGPRPVSIAPRSEPQTRTYNSLDATLATFSDKMVEIEYLFASASPDAVITTPGNAPLPVPQMLYFCVPRNDKLLAYWDTVADRLFKIRHCMNIAGIVRQLPLFEPPIDPELLVRAAAAGVDLSSVLDDVGAPLGHYRFSIWLQKATEICAEVRALGAEMLSTLEKRDIEALARLHASNEVNLLARAEIIRQQQYDEATEQISVLRRTRAAAEARYRYYSRMLGDQQAGVPAEGAAIQDAAPSGARIVREGGVAMLAQEQDMLSSLHDSHIFREIGVGLEFGAAVASAFPTFAIDAKPWGIGTGASWGGPNIGSALHALGTASQFVGEIFAYDADRAGRIAQFILREQEWALQHDLAAREIMMIDEQIAAARIRQSIALNELNNHRKQIEESQAIDEFLRGKYTNTELYEYLVGQVTTVYFQSYQLAFDLARKAERALRHELGVSDSDYIRFGYWDSARKGLLSGQRLMLDLKKMEAAYLDANVREYEIEKHISLASIHPQALIALRETGSCFVHLPEALFDLDHPGHYMRRIRSVAVTIPCTTGPYTSVGCTLTSLSSRTRVDPRATPAYAWQGPKDARFVKNLGGLQAIVTSTGREDHGVFSASHDEPRYMPFEGTGAISEWRLELPDQFRQFDYRSISDVVLHIRYTAREGGEPLKQAVLAKLAEAIRKMEIEEGRTGLFRGFDASRDFPDAWHQFLFRPVGQPGAQTLELKLSPDLFPNYLRDQAIKIDALLVAAQLKPGADYDQGDPLIFEVKPPAGLSKTLSLAEDPTVAGGLPAAAASFSSGISLSSAKPWSIALQSLPASLTEDVELDGQTNQRLNPDLIENVLVVCHLSF
jgi:hypothetical protein